MQFSARPLTPAGAARMILADALEVQTHAMAQWCCCSAVCPPVRHEVGPQLGAPQAHSAVVGRREHAAPVVAQVRAVHRPRVAPQHSRGRRRRRARALSSGVSGVSARRGARREVAHAHRRVREAACGRDCPSKPTSSHLQASPSVSRVQAQGHALRAHKQTHKQACNDRDNLMTVTSVLYVRQAKVTISACITRGPPSTSLDTG